VKREVDSKGAGFQQGRGGFSTGFRQQHKKKKEAKKKKERQQQGQEMKMVIQP
jgi:hypothetical protein